ncbi:helix-turn-helix domain-containing protein [Streptomyces sp. NPDC014656]|uniref:helix-turn-helix domain-containing protein n=1 Tax=Streptomyces sp. NPDC014656 TaxID=3364878 RepID=UPI0036F5408D
MTTAHQQTIPRQTSAFPAARALRRRPGDLPEPDERRRLRERWGLSTRQVATAFGVTPATVRSWEQGRTAPRGGRKEAYRRFLAGLAQHGEVARSRAAAGDRCPAADVRRPAHRPAAPVTPATVTPATVTPAAVAPAPRQGGTPGPAFPAAAGWVVRVGPGGAGADPVAPERVRRHRLLSAAACVWSLALWVLLTCPPPF